MGDQRRIDVGSRGAKIVDVSVEEERHLVYMSTVTRAGTKDSYLCTCHLTSK